MKRLLCMSAEARGELLFFSFGSIATLLREHLDMFSNQASREF